VVGHAVLLVDDTEDDVDLASQSIRHLVEHLLMALIPTDYMKYIYILYLYLISSRGSQATACGYSGCNLASRLPTVKMPSLYVEPNTYLLDGTRAAASEDLRVACLQVDCSRERALSHISSSNSHHSASCACIRSRAYHACASLLLVGPGRTHQTRGKTSYSHCITIKPNNINFLTVPSLVQTSPHLSH
jgi:hypothetical protein